MGEPVQVEVAEGPIVIRGADAVLLVEELERSMRFEQAARTWYRNLLDILPVQTFFSLPPFP